MTIPRPIVSSLISVFIFFSGLDKVEATLELEELSAVSRVVVGGQILRVVILVAHAHIVVLLLIVVSHVVVIVKLILLLLLLSLWVIDEAVLIGWGWQIPIAWVCEFLHFECLFNEYVLDIIGEIVDLKFLYFFIKVLFWLFF